MASLALRHLGVLPEGDLQHEPTRDGGTSARLHSWVACTCLPRLQQPSLPAAHVYPGSYGRACPLFTCLPRLKWSSLPASYRTSGSRGDVLLTGTSSGGTAHAVKRSFERLTGWPLSLGHPAGVRRTPRIFETQSSLAGRACSSPFRETFHRGTGSRLTHCHARSVTLPKDCAYRHGRFHVDSTAYMARSFSAIEKARLWP